ncbi:Hsp20/alpha crystallin family protein [Haloferula chungangensis]|uniref:Hsp20/alpha crystallin family protein n=1 Tax=Haloferula chungangensis TaxID=1048331 RepID=A0ABW2L2J9_9BACT
MNNDTTCCETDGCNTAVAEKTETTIRYTEPTWSADRHDQGVDLEITLPGVKKEDLNLEVLSRHLQLEAKRAAQENSGKLIYGQPGPEGYRLKLRLGDTLDGSALKASLADGILKVSIPLTESAQPRKVEIN